MPEPGRYWTVTGPDGAEGVVFQSPLDYPATITPMSPEAVVAVVDAIADEGTALPGVTGEAATAARFAGHWTERRHVPAIPTGGMRLYRLGGPRKSPTACRGTCAWPATTTSTCWRRGWSASTKTRARRRATRRPWCGAASGWGTSSSGTTAGLARPRPPPRRSPVPRASTASTRPTSCGPAATPAPASGRSAVASSTPATSACSTRTWPTPPRTRSTGGSATRRSARSSLLVRG